MALRPWHLGGGSPLMPEVMAGARGLVSSLELIIHKAEAQSCGETDFWHSIACS